MSRTTVSIAVLLCLTLGAQVGFSQGFSVGANAGYSLGAGTQVLGASSTTSGTTTSLEGVYGSLGEGFRFGVSGGYMFDENIGAELGLSYLAGKTFEITTSSGGVTAVTKLTGSGFTAAPSIVLSATMKAVRPYARLGVVIGILRAKQEIAIQQAGQSVEYVLEESGGLALGYAAALGIVVPTGGVVDLFAEAGLHSVTYSPRQAEVTKLTVNGSDQLSTLPQRVVEYEENVTSGSQNNELAVRRPFSAIGIVVGARVNL